MRGGWVGGCEGDRWEGVRGGSVGGCEGDRWD